ncbi:hypothetical protein IFM89_012317 [Coptis chinensis]|uniref:Uncharacterized protein n=1 Tax=Coptis chinensis TaxID=261450 RepID=A0A835LUS1_9MAGN|nr:hypothetical protein IFM89_012317 [Coptis chinensis]
MFNVIELVQNAKRRTAKDGPSDPPLRVCALTVVIFPRFLSIAYAELMRAKLIYFIMDITDSAYQNQARALLPKVGFSSPRAGK